MPKGMRSMERLGAKSTCRPTAIAGGDGSLKSITYAPAKQKSPNRDSNATMPQKATGFPSGLLGRNGPSPHGSRTGVEAIAKESIYAWL